MRQEENKNIIELTVRHGGNKVHLEENIHHTIKHVLHKALQKFEDEHGFTPPQNSTPVLAYAGNNLDPEKRLSDYNIPDKAVLDLVLPTAGTG